MYVSRVAVGKPARFTLKLTGYFILSFSFIILSPVVADHILLLVLLATEALPFPQIVSSFPCCGGDSSGVLSKGNLCSFCQLPLLLLLSLPTSVSCGINDII